MFAEAALWASLAVVGQTGGERTCPADHLLAGGSITKTEFFAAPLDRTREAVADAMQAAGVLLFENAGRIVRGERTTARVKQMGLPSGNEAVAAYLEDARLGSVSGTRVRVETSRPRSKPGPPNQSWSGAVLDETGCLLGLLAVAGPEKGRPESALPAVRREVVVRAGTPVRLLLRRFVFSAELRTNQRLIWEAAADVRVGDDVVIPRGALAVARVGTVDESVSWGKGARAAFSLEFVAGAGGERVSIKADREMVGANVRAEDLAIAALLRTWLFNPSGREFALRAGSPIDAVVDRDQTVSVGAPAPAQH